jgi:hypothetical protein
MLAIRREIVAGAVFDRENADRRQYQQGKAGEESGTGGYHSVQISCGLAEVKRGTAFEGCASGSVQRRWS